MALITCSECGKQISDKAVACPNCGCPLEPAQNTTGSTLNADAAIGGTANTVEEKQAIQKRILGEAVVIALIVVAIIVVAVIVVVTGTKKSGIDLRDYDGIVDSRYIEIAADGSYLTIDTNPYDIKDSFAAEADAAIESLNKKLGIPSSVFKKMGETRALDGRQTEEYNGVRVSWTYHPDNGLEVMYEVIE